jgi:hypothetical protein
MGIKDLRRMRRGALGAAVACLAVTGLLGLSGVATAAPSEWSATGSGTLATGALSNGDQFAGNFQGNAGYGNTSGHWTHRTTTGDRLSGTVVDSVCWSESAEPLVSRCAIGGPGILNGEVVFFHARITDRGVSGPDEYVITAQRASDGYGIFLAAGVVQTGNIKIRL